MKFSVVVPVYNEEFNLNPLHTRLTNVLKSLGSYEIIFVDDGSTDRSLGLLTSVAEVDKNVKVISFTRNFGQHSAVMAGLRESSGEIVITIDADLQNPPEEIPKLLGPLEIGYDVSCGLFLERKHNLFRKLGSRFSKWIMSKVIPVQTGLSGYRAIKREVVDNLLNLKERNRFIDGLICWMGYKVCTVGVQHDKRHSGKSKYSVFKLIKVWFDLVSSLSDFPLKIATWAGFITGGCGFGLAIFYLARYFMFGYPVQGFATTVILITIFAGVQLVCLGIVGEYIGRMNNEVRDKPDYIIRK